MSVVPVATELTPLTKNAEKKDEFIEVEIHENRIQNVLQNLFEDLLADASCAHILSKEKSVEKWTEQEFAIWKVRNPKFLQLCAQLKKTKQVTFEIFYQKNRALTAYRVGGAVTLLALLKKERALYEKKVEMILPRLCPTTSQKAWGTALQVGVLAIDSLSLWGLSTLSDAYLRFFGYFFGGIGLAVLTGASFITIPSIFNRCCYKGDNLGLQKYIATHSSLQGLDLSFSYKDVSAPFCSCEHI